MALSSTAQRRGKFEALEPRQMLAGNVAVSVDGGLLKLEGDAEANKIMITSGTEVGAYVVTGLDGTDLEDAPAPITFTGIRNIRVNLGDGEDLAVLVGANVRGNVSIRTGADNDRVLVGTSDGAAELASVVLPADLSVNVHGLLKINTDGGEDLASVDDSVASLLSVDTGDDNDIANLGSTLPLGDQEARLSVRYGVHVNLGAGNDGLNANQLSTHGLFIARGGEGNNTIDASLVEATALFAWGDGGIDDFSFVDLDVHHLGIHTGEEADIVEVRDSVFRSLGVSLGDGDDTLTTAGLEANIAVLSGGDGVDTLDESVASVFTHKRIQGFEIPPDVNVNDLLRRGRGLFGRLFGLWHR